MRHLTYALLMLAILGFKFHPISGQSSEAIEISVQRLKASDESNYRHLLDELYGSQKEVSLDSAKTYLQALLKVAERLPYKNAIPYIHIVLGQLHRDHKLYPEAFAYFEDALIISRQNNLPYEEAQSKSSLGTLMLDQFKVNQAITYYLEAADLFNEFGFLPEAQKMYIKLGSINFNAQNYRRAINYLKKVFYANKHAYNLRDRMLAANNIGLAFSQKKMPDSALWYYEKALEIAYALPDSFYIGLISGNASIFYLEKGNSEKAVEYLKKDIRLSKKYEEWGSAASAMVGLVSVYQNTGNFEMAESYLDSATQIAQKLNNTKLKKMVYEAYIGRYQQEQDYQKAFEYLALVKQIDDTLHRQIQKQRAAEIDAAYNFDKKLAEINLLQQDSKLQSLIIGIFGISTGLLLVFSLILGKLIRQRTHANQVLALQKQDIEQRNATLETQKDKILEQNEALESANRQISLLNKKLDQKVKFSEEILRSAYEKASEAFFILRGLKDCDNIKQFVCLDVNHAATQLLDRPKEEIVGDHLFSLFPFLKANEHLNSFIKVCEENLNFDQDIYIGQDGKFPAWIQVMANQIEGGIAIKIKNITRRKEQEQQLKEREASISAMINNTTDLILSIDPAFKLTEFNKPFAKTVEIQYGFIPRRGQSVFDAIHAHNIKDARKNFDKALRGEQVSDQYEIPASNGEVIYAEAFFSPVILDKQPIGATVVIRNITDRKKGEINLKEALSKVQESEKFLSEIIENLPVGLQIYDSFGELIQMNEAQMVLLGLEEVPPKQLNVLKEPFYKAYGIDRLFAHAYQGNPILNQEVLIDMGNPSKEWKAINHKRWLSISTLPIKDENGLVQSVIGLFADITERKEAEVALKESEERLRTVINNIPIILWTTNREGIFTMSEGKALEKLALQPGQVVGISIFDLYANFKDQLKVLKDAMEKGITYESTDRVGKTVFNAKVFPMRNELGEISGLIGMSIDITDRIEYEEKLKRSEANLNAIINNNTYNIWSVDTDLKITAVNDAFKEAFKMAFGAELKIGEQASNHIPKSEVGIWREGYKKALDGTHHIFEYSFADNFYEVSMYPIHNEGVITGVAVFSQDVTQRKMAENQIRESQQFLNGIIENMPIGLQIFDEKGTLIRINRAFQQAMNLPDQQCGIGKMNILKDKVSRKIGTASLAERAYLGETLASQEVKLNFGVHENQWDTFKSELWHNITMFPIHDKGKEIKAVVVLTEDITERKRTNEKLIESEERLILATKTAKIGIWDIDLHSHNVLWDDTMVEIYGLQTVQFNHQLDFWNQWLHPEDLNRVVNETKKLQMGEGNNAIEFRIVRPDGQIRHIKGLSQVYHNHHNEPVRIIGVNLDITEMKEKEEKLRQQQQEIIETNKKIAEYRLMALRSVMNPHFLFNSLNSIQYFIAKNERELALNYLSLFSKLIRGILHSSVNATIGLSQELEVLKYYVELEALRFENKFETAFIIDDELDVDNIEVPSLLIQPYVENAILHGLYNKTGNGKLIISLSQQKNLLKCVIEDDGVGRKEAQRIKKQNAIRHKSVGMMVTKERLDIINKTNHVSVKIYDLKNQEGKPLGTKVEIFIQI